MKDYQVQTLNLVKKENSKLNQLSDQQIADLYSNWSTIFHSAGWVGCGEEGVKEFVRWATYAPCDLLSDYS